VKITLVAGDFMQGQEFHVFAKELEQCKHKVRTFLVDGKPPKFTEENVEQAVTDSDFVLLAVSNSFNETLLAGLHAVKNQIPFGIYAASQPVCYLGANLEPLRQNCQLLFVFNESEVRPAKNLFPNATIVASSSPNWEKFFFPELTRNEARARLNIGDDENMILVPGDKDLILNILLFAATIEAAGKLECSVQVVIALHPGDQNPISAYADLAKFVPDNVSVTFIRREARDEVLSGLDFRVLPTPLILPGADVMVTFVSTLGYEAACQRIPVICFFPIYGAIWLEKEAGIKPGEWEQVKNQTALEVRGISADALQQAMEDALFNSEGDDLKQWQKDIYPTPPEEGSAVKVVVNALESFQR
jgi:hypothetical protein